MNYLTEYGGGESFEYTLEHRGSNSSGSFNLTIHFTRTGKYGIITTEGYITTANQKAVIASSITDTAVVNECKRIVGRIDNSTLILGGSSTIVSDKLVINYVKFNPYNNNSQIGLWIVGTITATANFGVVYNTPYTIK